MNLKKIGVVLLTLLLAGMAMVPMVSAEDELSELKDTQFLIEGSTSIISDNTQGRVVQNAAKVPFLNELMIPETVQKFDLVTFDIPSISKNLKNSQNCRVSIGDRRYSMVLNRANFETIDDGIDSYTGRISEDKDSEVLITVAENVITGSVRLHNETFYFKPVVPEKLVSAESPVLHIIYSSDDVVEGEPIKIDDGTLSIPAGEDDQNFSLIPVSNRDLQNAKATMQWKTVNIVVVTDNAFFTQESNWKVTAQDIINTANSQNVFGRDDIKVSLSVMAYDDSRRQLLSNDPDIISSPLETFKYYYPNSDLNAKSADIALYLGGYNADGGAQGNSWGFGNGNIWGQYAWAQMVYDDPLYTGTVHGRRSISIHELGHIFDANHESSAGTNRAYEWWNPLPQHTVMYSYFTEGMSVNEFSSDNYHGDTTHDNALSIDNAKNTVATYRNS
jgi:hypothetical protein